MSDKSEADVMRRVPAVAGERLRVLSLREPLTVPPGTSLADCIRAIQRTGTGDSVFVLDEDGRLAGVLTERDVFDRLVGPDVGQGVDVDAPVEAFMNMNPNTLRLEQTVLDALVLMQSRRYRNVPLVDDDGRLVGVIRQVDILKFFAESFPEELLNLPPRPHQRMEQAEGG